jgi:hypothetical protein
MQSLIEREGAMRKTVVTMLLLAAFGVTHAGDLIAAGAEARERAPLSIAIDGPKGSSFQLVYKAGNGWEFANYSATKLVSAAQQDGPTGLIETLPTDTLQSVFVDGPTGYVFVYVIDEGWKFVGSVADKKR